MGLELLEERFQHYKKTYLQHLSTLKSLAKQASAIQLMIRELLDNSTIELCTACTTKCCTGMPCDGWFTEEDYFPHRMLYDMPLIVNPATAGEPYSCSFLLPSGCSLPQDMRPFACVKVNCVKLNQKLELDGKISQFKQLCEELDDIQVELWEIIGNNG